jgi:hypothetical protein
LKRTRSKQTTRAKPRISAERVAEMIEEATVDAYDESEQAIGWLAMFENHLDLPFDTDVLGVRVTVEKIDLRDDNRIVAVCRRGKQKQSIAITELPLPTPKPAGADWIEAYSHWRGRQWSSATFRP